MDCLCVLLEIASQAARTDPDYFGPYKYSGSQSVRPGQMYIKTMQRITISM